MALKHPLQADRRGSWARAWTRAWLALALAAAWGSMALAAVPDSRPYASPDIHPDRTVTFRILAPKASEVTLEGGWMASKETVPLVKDDKGLWSVTVGPLKATTYAYWFNLDGAPVLDEANPVVRERTGSSSVSTLEIAGDPSQSWSLRDVPHGAVENHLVKSAAFGDTRSVWVYLPPGYRDSATRRYPILYLFHGGGELQLSWVQSGKANLIFDNLIADGTMKPAIVVMPYTGPAARAPQPPPPAAPGGPPSGRAPGPGQTFVLDELVPWSAAHFRTLEGRKNRALAGFSAGGVLATAVAFKDLNGFSQLGVFSSPIPSIAQAYPRIVADPAGVNAKLDVFWIGVGKSDPQVAGWLRGDDAELTKAGIRHDYHETEGAHDYAVWRWALTQYAPLLFRH